MKIYVITEQDLDGYGFGTRDVEVCRTRDDAQRKMRDMLLDYVVKHFDSTLTAEVLDKILERPIEDFDENYRTIHYGYGYGYVDGSYYLDIFEKETPSYNEKKGILSVSFVPKGSSALPSATIPTIAPTTTTEIDYVDALIIVLRKVAVSRWGERNGNAIIDEQIKNYGKSSFNNTNYAISGVSFGDILDDIFSDLVLHDCYDVISKGTKAEDADGEEWEYITESVSTMDYEVLFAIHRREERVITEKRNAVADTYRTQTGKELRKHKVYVWTAKSDDGAFEITRTEQISRGCYYDNEKDCYNSMRTNALEKMKWNTEYADDFENNEDSIGYEVSFSRRKIVHTSYSGIYTYEIEEVYI